MSPLLIAVLAWLALCLLAVLVIRRAGRWYRSSDTDTELQKMIKKTRRKMR